MCVCVCWRGGAGGFCKLCGTVIGSRGNSSECIRKKKKRGGGAGRGGAGGGFCKRERGGVGRGGTP